MQGKIYIIVTPTIKLVGGAQIYSLNKLHYYQRKGWNTLLLHAGLPGAIVIDELRKYEKNYAIEFQFCSYLYSKKKINSVLTKIILDNKLDKYSDIIIESHNTESATWAEILAQRLNAKHLVFLLSEFPKIKPKGLLGFYDMKEKRGELAGISQTSISKLFNGFSKKYYSQNHFLSAVCSNSIGPANKLKLPNFRNYDYMIASIGRMEKPYVNEAVDEILKFADKYPKLKLAVLFIGDGMAKKKNTIIQKLGARKNVQTYITGPVYPIPINLLRIPNLFFGVAGSCNVSKKVGKITVSFDVDDHKAIGVYGITTESTTYRKKGELPLEFSQLLNDILINQKYKEHLKNIDIEAENKIDFSSHDNFLKSSSTSKNFYDIGKIHKSLKDWFIFILIFFLGVKETIFLKKIRFR